MITKDMSLLELMQLYPGLETICCHGEWPVPGVWERLQRLWRTRPNNTDWIWIDFWMISTSFYK